METPEPGQVRYARNGGVRIAFEELGGAGGDPLLLIMGLAVSRFWWPDGRQAGAKWHGGRLSQLRGPALVLHGAADPLLRPAAGRRTAAAISGARLVILPGVGHYLPAEVYPQVASEVRALADQAAASTGTAQSTMPA